MQRNLKKCFELIYTLLTQCEVDLTNDVRPVNYQQGTRFDQLFGD